MSPKKNSLLWKLEHPEFPAASYLFGTMHVQDLRTFGQWPLMQEKIKECDAFAVEFDLEDEGRAASFSATLIPGGRLFSDFIPEKKYKKLRRILLRSTGFDLNQGQRTLPFLLLGAISGHMLQNEMPTSLDEQLWAFAKSEGKQLLGIETLDEQLSVLKNIPMDAQVKMLLDLGRNISSYRKQLFHLTELYKKEELGLLHKSVKKQAGGLRKLMLYRRNEVMTKRIFDLASAQKTFAGVGAGHLGGGKGVLRLLKKQGVKLKPIKS